MHSHTSFCINLYNLISLHCFQWCFIRMLFIVQYFMTEYPLKFIRSWCYQVNHLLKFNCKCLVNNNPVIYWWNEKHYRTTQLSFFDVIHLFTNNFEQFSICFRQSEVIETNCISMKQFPFYCDKLHCIRSDIVQTVVKFVSVKYSLFQMQHECFKQREDCSNPVVKRWNTFQWADLSIFN